MPLKCILKINSPFECFNSRSDILLASNFNIYVFIFHIISFPFIAPPKLRWNSHWETSKSALMHTHALTHLQKWNCLRNRNIKDSTWTIQRYVNDSTFIFLFSISLPPLFLFLFLHPREIKRPEHFLFYS